MNDYVMIANAWSAGVANPTSKHRIAIELARRGARVLWVEGSGMRAPNLASGHDRGRLVRKLRAGLRGAQATENGIRKTEGVVAEGKIWTLSPLLIPLPKYRLVRVFNGRLCAARARRWARQLGFQTPALINYVPVLADALRGWPWRKVYHCVDRWDAFAMYDRAVMAAGDAACCRWSELVVATSGDLAERCGRLNPNTHLITHGVDHAHFARALENPPRPADLPPGRVVGFFGLLSEWLDQDLILALARALPDAALVLIGMADVPVDRLRGVPNLHLPGPRPFAALPAYAAHFQVGLIPFVVNDLTRAVNPIKLREMLSAGCPVVSTDLPEVRAYARPRGVAVADTPDAFIQAVRGFLDAPATPAERAALSESMRDETWSAKVEDFCRLIGAPAMRP